jgi:uncharacterized protein (TIGR00369 family)
MAEVPRDLTPQEKDRFAEIKRQRTLGSPYYQLLGMELMELGHGECRFRLAADSKLHNLGGVVHGGALASIADAAMGVSLATLTDPHSERPVTVELKINFMAAVVEGELTARGRIIQRGRTVAVGEAEVTDAEGRLVAKAMGTFVIRGRNTE